jgi:hypothetical protein
MCAVEQLSHAGYLEQLARLVDRSERWIPFHVAVLLGLVGWLAGVSLGACFDYTVGPLAAAGGAILGTCWTLPVAQWWRKQLGWQAAIARGNLVEGGVLRLMVETTQQPLTERLAAGLTPDAERMTLRYQLRRLPVTYDAFCAQLGLQGHRPWDRALNWLWAAQFVALFASFQSNWVFWLRFGLVGGCLAAYLAVYLGTAKQRCVERAIVGILPEVNLLVRSKEQAIVSRET